MGSKVDAGNNLTTYSQFLTTYSRLKDCMGDVIGRNQFAFIQGRQILDCSLIANEIIHFLRVKKEDGVVLKLDFEKAFDSVEWSFLDLILSKMNFGVKWRGWIQSCIRSASLSVLVNGSPSKLIKMKKGLRQGCPLSPFLFNIVGEAFSVLCDKAVRIGLFEGITLNDSAWSVSHLQFADDTLLFCHPEIQQLANVKRYLKCFELISGLKTNFAKCSFFGFGSNIQQVKDWVASNLCSVGQLPTRYLGLPLGAPKNSKELWQPVVDKLQGCLGNWKVNYLSIGGRVTLIKSVLSSIPMYYMSLYKMPKSVVDKIDKMVRMFLWGGSESKRKMHLVDWSTVTRPKSLGGLGISNIEIQNNALLFKWVWRYGNESDSLWRKVIDVKLGNVQGRMIPYADVRRKTSFIWRNISQFISPASKYYDCCISGLGISLGNGASSLFWHDNWLNGVILKDIFPRIYNLATKKNGVILEYGHWHENCWTWDVSLRRPCFNWELEQWNEFMNAINGAFLDSNRRDQLVWKGTTCGKFSVRSFYQRACGFDGSKSKLWSSVWAGIGPPKVEIFLWQVMRERVAVKAEIAKRGLITESMAQCPLCGLQLETVRHLFFQCIYTWRVWMNFLSLKGVQWGCPGDPVSFFQSWIGTCSSDHVQPWCMMFLAITWSIWLFRNQIVFNGQHWDQVQIERLIKTRYAFWFKAKWPENMLSVDALIREPLVYPITTCGVSIREITEWCKPEVGCVKFNVDASAIGKPGPAGIGGILRDSDGTTLAIFSKSVGIMDSNEAEFMAVREAFVIMVNSSWKSSSFIVESDSRNAIAWTENSDLAPWKLRSISNHLSCLKKQVNEWRCVHVYREANMDADALAKQGVNRTEDLLIFYN